MKIRQGFVTNSSSSSYVVLYKVKIEDLTSVINRIKDEHGNCGMRDLFSDVSFENDCLVFRDVAGDLEELFDSVDHNKFDKDYSG